MGPENCRIVYEAHARDGETCLMTLFGGPKQEWRQSIRRLDVTYRLVRFGVFLGLQGAIRALTSKKHLKTRLFIREVTCMMPRKQRDA